MTDETPLQQQINIRALEMLALHASVNEEASHLAQRIADKNSIEHQVFRIGIFCGSAGAVQVFADRNLIRRDEV